ncbi:PEP/pyruvate-binding domain-containing protein [Fundidesulfovibrio agrisoli]|uniref:PEP/pyruvate-binding domain-containing protein n=1 Tax=Fundidesulfovibrio agrisoli TaxID=2922717 RepID=UPI001FABC487|nr:PEP/pyruvate-binding domain-containing protein [Fundidesulfovibrio agrisoli]
MHSPILTNLKRLLLPLVGRKPQPLRKDQNAFRFKYANFQELLESNSDVLRTIASLEEMLPGREVFGMSFLQSAASQAVFHCLRMLRGYENLSGEKLPALRERIEAIREELKNILASGRGVAQGPWFLDLDEIAQRSGEFVGGKCANLAETRNSAGMPVPDGFCVTTAAFRAFLEHSDLDSEIAKRTMGLDASDPASLQQASEDIQRLILLAPFPDGFEAQLLERHAALALRTGQGNGDFRVSLRSSAVGEDGALSFAGQYLSVLGVAPGKVAESYRYVAASLYTPRAMAYRLLKGVPDEAAAMAVVCLEMVRSRSSGVLYTRHPFEPGNSDVLINAVWGLGPYAVDGVVNPNRFSVDRESLEIISQDVPGQEVRLECGLAGGLVESAVDQDSRSKACLSPLDVKTLARWGLQLEEHFGAPQDVEWAQDEAGRLLVLQSRPLAAGPAEGAAQARRKPLDGYTVLAEGGDAACPGAGCGPVFIVRREDDLAEFPEGGVLVADHSSPSFMVAMNKASAIVTEHGSVTGHMASLAREFNVPTVLGLRGAMSTLEPGARVTVDATNRRIYAGRVEPLLAENGVAPAPMLGTPVHDLLKRVSVLVSPLHLVDPKSPAFTPQHCATLHDVTRFLHERCYAAMFRLGDQASGEGGMAVRLDVGIGLDLHVIDLGGGLRDEVAGADRIKRDDVLSRPFMALLRGLADKDFVASGPRPVQLRGFLSVMGRQMIDGANQGAERFGEKSYAIVSDKYLNFSSRVGYHYGVLDSYCGKTVAKNYITFAFKGGAAGEDRRERRARAIALILEALGFKVAVTGDRVEGRFQKYPPDIIEEKLVQIGRLLQFTRQTDMLMTSDSAVPAMVESFLRGDTVFGASCPLPPSDG